MAVYKNFTFRRLIKTGEHVEHGGFTGSVGADNGPKFAGFHFQIKIIYGAQTTELDADMIRL
ncbi:hypothetical protein SDC9_159935 [bioreactor metagenome]|uniref:Uncharacterized protein n=1 Tax=bioreactor metagenome TaxID=1076179 RepID=A0A645FE82_9ZZZZ